MLELFPGGGHDFLEAALCPRFCFRGENEAHPSSRHPPEHPKPPEGLAKICAHSLDECFSKVIACPRDDGLDRLLEVAGGRVTDPLDIAVSQRRQDLLQNSQHALARLPLGRGTKQVLFGDHFQNRPDVLGHSAVDQHQTLLKPITGLRGNRTVIQDSMCRH